MMNFITKVGNLKMYFEMERDSLGSFLTIYAINGSDIVEREIFPDATPKDARACAERLLQHLDIVTLDDITAGIADIYSEYGGRLLSGKIAGFSTTEYFKQFPDNHRYYKHFVERPAM